MARQAPDDLHRDDELGRRSSAFAEGLNCLGLALCVNGLRLIREKHGSADVRDTLQRSAEVCLDFVVWLASSGARSELGVDLKAAEQGFEQLRAMLLDPRALEPEKVDALRLSIRGASLAFGIELPAHPMAAPGATCEYHGAICPGPEAEPTAKKGS